MKLKKTLFFHVGWPKCLSLSLQYSLAHKVTKDKNYALITVGIQNLPKSNRIIEITRYTRPYDVSHDIVSLAESFSNLIDSIDADNIIISNEVFFHYPHKDLTFLFDSLSKNFHNSKMLIICRNQKDFLISQYGEWSIKCNALGSFGFFIRLQGLLQNCSLSVWHKLVEKNKQTLFLEDPNIYSKLSTFFEFTVKLPHKNKSHSLGAIQFAAMENLFINQAIGLNDAQKEIFWNDLFKKNKKSINNILGNSVYGIASSNDIEVINNHFKKTNLDLNVRYKGLIPKEFFERFDKKVPTKSLSGKQVASLRKILTQHIQSLI
jgi:hypothetical protein